MRTLPDEQREAVALVLVEGLAYKEAAAILDVPMGTLTSRLVRGPPGADGQAGRGGVIPDDEMLMAYADGELDPLAAKRVERAIAADPALAAKVAAQRALRARLGAAFAPVADAPVPDRLAAMLTPDVLPLLPRPVPARQRWMQAAALAATLVLGIAVGNQMRSPPVTMARGRAHGIRNARTRAGYAARRELAGETHMLASFRDRSGAWCRVFTTPSLGGIACRERGDWILRRTRSPDRRQAADYRQAGSADAALMAEAQDMMAGDPLDAARRTPRARPGLALRRIDIQEAQRFLRRGYGVPCTSALGDDDPREARPLHGRNDT